MSSVASSQKNICPPSYEPPPIDVLDIVCKTEIVSREKFKGYEPDRAAWEEFREGPVSIHLLNRVIEHTRDPELKQRYQLMLARCWFFQDDPARALGVIASCHSDLMSRLMRAAFLELSECFEEAYEDYIAMPALGLPESWKSVVREGPQRVWDAWLKSPNLEVTDLEKLQERGTVVHSLIAQAELGSALAMLYLGACYEYGIGCKIDLKKSFSWHYKAAAQGDSTACYNVGFCYEYGERVKKNLKMAHTWFQKSADLGHEAAKKKLKKKKWKDVECI